MITDYKQVKEDVLKCYDNFLDIVKRAGYPKDDDRSIVALKNQAKNIKEDSFCLMIAGEAKSGKSTFINAYLGTEILPMDVRQCTSSIVKIRYGKNFVLTATFADGKKQNYHGAEEIHAFLKANSAISDDYRDIPVTTINNEIIVKYKGKTPLEEYIKDLIKGVAAENIHKLPEEEYEHRIRRYIELKTAQWRDIVTEIEIQYPFEDKDMRGITIIDSPGVNAAGRVGDVTDSYIEKADAIMFLRPITGVAIESQSFKSFLESNSVDRNKNAMFLILTRAANETADTIDRAREEFVRMYGIEKTKNGHGIIKDLIIHVDSKAELYFNKFSNMPTEEIKSEVMKLNANRQIESFVVSSWLSAECCREAFLKELKQYSNFEKLDQSLNRFGRRSRFISLSQFLDRMLKVYKKVTPNLRERIKLYQLKAKDPQELARKIKDVEKELARISNAMNNYADEIQEKYVCINGIIDRKADDVMSEYSCQIDNINASDSAMEELEKISFRQIDTFKEYEAELQKNVVDECNAALVRLVNKDDIEYVTLEPDFSPEVIEEIKKSTEDEAKEYEEYTTGITFKETKKRPRYSKNRHYELVRDSIKERIDKIKNDARRDVKSFVMKTIVKYTKELRKNFDNKMKEMYKLEAEKKQADEIAVIIKELSNILDSISPQENSAENIKKGIDCCVQF